MAGPVHQPPRPLLLLVQTGSGLWWYRAYAPKPSGHAGVDVAALTQEFGQEMIEPALQTVERLVNDGLLTFDGERVRLTARGRLIANDVFQEFLEPQVVEARQGA